MECAMQISPKCPKVLDYDTLTVDRYPTPGANGGTYGRENIRPACQSCNSMHGNILKAQMAYKRDKQARRRKVDNDVSGVNAIDHVSTVSDDVLQSQRHS